MKALAVALVLAALSGCAQVAYFGRLEAQDSADTPREVVVYWTKTERMLWFDTVSGGVRVLTECSANTLDYELTVKDPATFTRPWKANFPLPRVQAPNDPYAAEAWEQACHEGNLHHIEGIKSLGFKWYFGPQPPAR